MPESNSRLKWSIKLVPGPASDRGARAKRVTRSFPDNPAELSGMAWQGKGVETSSRAGASEARATWNTARSEVDLFRTAWANPGGTTRLSRGPREYSRPSTAATADPESSVIDSLTGWV